MLPTKRGGIDRWMYVDALKIFTLRRIRSSEPEEVNFLRRLKTTHLHRVKSDNGNGLAWVWPSSGPGKRSSGAT
ncbi:hypothetical protein RRG08_051651 [Elysia crispata]|uniref:Uncharacterized protein n=1 Tax=Elysia crispata TaxID=231223 RepID=A0AAE1A2K6_9GAST|nr:hypothetical protein RRG08_051651 [Elysia crispata]